MFVDNIVSNCHPEDQNEESLLVQETIFEELKKLDQIFDKNDFLIPCVNIRIIGKNITKLETV